MRFRGILVGVLAVTAGCPGPKPFTSVELDPDNKTGFQFETPEFDVAQGTEEQDCYFVAMPDLKSGADYYMNKIRSGVNPGSHHMNVFQVIPPTDGTTNPLLGDPTTAPGTVVKNGECFKSSNWSTWPLITNSQQSDASDPYFTWTLPTNVAWKFSPNELLMVQIHYVNASTQMTPEKGKVVIDMYPSPDAAPMELGTLFATEQSIRICESNPTPTFHGTCGINTGGSPVHIVAANGHFHSRGTQFDMFTWDGVSTTHPTAQEKFYESDVWNDPPMMKYNEMTPPEDIVDNAGVWWDCSYQWQDPTTFGSSCDALNTYDAMKNPGSTPDCCYAFGPHVDTNEHCNAFVYYYPKLPAGSITCQ
jgi:hypothetical protein